jgi:hypothetical protein
MRSSFKFFAYEKASAVARHYRQTRIGGRKTKVSYWTRDELVAD